MCTAGSPHAVCRERGLSAAAMIIIPRKIRPVNTELRILEYFLYFVFVSANICKL